MRRFISTQKVWAVPYLVVKTTFYCLSVSLRQVFNGDRVKVRQTSVDRKGKAWGFITEVVERRVKQIIGKVSIHEGEYFIQPSNPNAHQPITLERELIEHAKSKIRRFCPVLQLTTTQPKKNLQRVISFSLWPIKPILKLLFPKLF